LIYRYFAVALFFPKYNTNRHDFLGSDELLSVTARNVSSSSPSEAAFPLALHVNDSVCAADTQFTESLWPEQHHIDVWILQARRALIVKLGYPAVDPVFW
jgi:hypothetical protein